MIAKSTTYPFPKFPLQSELPWLKNVSVWSSPTSKPRADARDAFLVAGDGLIVGRLGLGDRASTMDRILAPHLSSFNFGENNNFFLDAIQPSRDFYPPLHFAPHTHHVWRVRKSAIVITAERDDTFELVTANAVHPHLHAIIRYASLRNITKKAIRDIGISFNAKPDIPFPVAGSNSRLELCGNQALLETLEEKRTILVDSAPRVTEEFERFRYLVRGAIGAKARGYYDLFLHVEELEPNKWLTGVHYLVPGIDGTPESAVESANRLALELKQHGVAKLFQEAFDFWTEEFSKNVCFESSQQEFTELVENNLILQHSVERATGGYVVIDDYSGTWLRDHNGPHKLLLDFGRHEDIRRSMDRYYGLDCTYKTLVSCYPSDFEPSDPVPPEADWSAVQQFVTGDVPNFRAAWYDWYFSHTGDLEYVRSRFNYMLGAFMRQRLHENGYLASYCFDETYGIGPVGPMRSGISCDNSFIALRAADVLAKFSRLLGRDDADYLEDYAARIRTAIEQTFWLSRKGYYAMRITPQGKRDETPLSIGLLRPLWTSALNTDDDHAIRSAIFTYTHLYQKNGFLKLIPSHEQTVTMAIGYLLVAMKKINYPDVDRVLNDALKWSDASGTFGEYLDDSLRGPVQCYEHLAHRNRMWESGLNTDAIFYALTGFEPHAYEHRVKLSPYLPKGWKHAKFERLRIGNTYLSLEMHRSKRGTTYKLKGLSGNSIGVSFQLRSLRHDPVKLNGVRQDLAWVKNRFGVHTAMMNLSLEPGDSILVH